jgi:tetratricopeptide (TPR) repeat protein
VNGSDGDYGGARRLAEASLDLYLRLPDSTAEALGVRITVAICEALLGNTRRAAELLEAAAVSARASGNDLELAMVVSSLGNLALDQRDFRGARTYFEEAMELTRRLRQPPLLANTLSDLGFVDLAESAVDEAAAHFTESLSICRAEHLTPTLVWTGEGLAAVALARGEPAVATQLLGSTGRLRAEVGSPEGYYKIGDETRKQTLETARQLLGEPAFATALAEGESLSLEELTDAAALVV